MKELDFRTYLETLTSSKTRRPLGRRVVNNIVSRCATAERKIGRDLDTLPLAEGTSRTVKRRRYDETIPELLTGDYRCAVRKYLDFRLTK